MADLPIDMLFYEVFLRLPAKSLSRLRCVCKLWNCLSRKPDFATTHLDKIVDRGSYNANHHKHLILFSSKGETEFGFRVLDYGHGTGSMARRNFPLEIREKESITFLGSCHGLVCIGIEKERDRILTPYADLVLWNPLTGDYEKLNMYEKLDMCGSDLYNPNAVGFGYDSLTDDYKIVYVYDDRAYISCLKSKETKVVTSIPTGCFASSTSWLSCFVNGNLYWGSPSSVVCFDLGSDKFTNVSSPNDEPGERFRMLKVIRGSLHMVISAISSLNEHVLHIWKMDENKNGVWTKTMTISYPSNIRDSLLYPLCFMENGDMLMYGGGACETEEKENGEEEGFVDDDSRNAEEKDTGAEFVAYDVENHELGSSIRLNIAGYFKDDIPYMETLISPSVICS